MRIDKQNKLDFFKFTNAMYLISSTKMRKAKRATRTRIS